MSTSQQEKQIAATKEREKQVTDLVQDRFPKATAVRICNRFPEFVQGALYVVEYTDEDSEEDEVYVYSLNDSLQLLHDIHELAVSVGKTPESPNFINTILQLGGISGVIAVIITLTICYLTIQNGGQENFRIPDIFANALSVILGFYFGATAQKAVQQAGE